MSLQNEQFDENTIEYTPESGCISTLTQSRHPYGEKSWIYEPTDETTEKIISIRNIKTISEIWNHLPNSLLVNDEILDYPTFINHKVQFGRDKHLNREVFVIAGYYFFRRYNDNWNSTVMCYTEKRHWFALSTNGLNNLHKLITNKELDKITQTDVDQAISE